MKNLSVIILMACILFFYKDDLKKFVDSLLLKAKDIPQDLAKLREIDAIRQAMDMENPETRKFAVNIAKQYPGEYNLRQVCAIWSFCKNKWKYVNDPRGINYVAKASETIQLGLAGDCDDFAVLIATLVESIASAERHA